MIVCTLIGNAMVCLAVFSVRRLKNQPANLLLVSLAVADFCVGLFVMPIALIKIIDDDWLSGKLKLFGLNSTGNHCLSRQFIQTYRIPASNFILI
jgi:formate/nitrite transporter FocA (FNT family)